MTGRTTAARETVYVIGAGFSKDCGYPLTRDLLPQVWARLARDEKSAVERIIRFHHPQFDPNTRDSFPGIEVLLTEIAVNIDLFDSTRWRSGRLVKEALISARSTILLEIAYWFHELYASGSRKKWLTSFVQRVKAENAGIVSFNWDLLLDQALFGARPQGENYGLRRQLPSEGPIILKPHGSLNWYLSEDVQGVKSSKRRPVFEADDPQEDVDVFVPPRRIESSSGKTYTPILVAPTYLKDFRRPIFRLLWRHCTDLLSMPKRIVFLGYSLPPDDLQARFILRCGFYNQSAGMLLGRTTNGKSRRAKPTGNAEVIVVNPDLQAFRHVGEIANMDSPIIHHKQTVVEWLKGAP